jgi:hypothetical protein
MNTNAGDSDSASGDGEHQIKEVLTDKSFCLSDLMEKSPEFLFQNVFKVIF